jgi:hypothetical protein
MLPEKDSTADICLDTDRVCEPVNERTPERALGKARAMLPVKVRVPAGTTVPTIDAALASPLSAYADPAAPTGPENTADRNTINALRAEMVQARNYLEALRAEVVQLRSYAEALRTEVVALRAAATTRAGYTLRTTVSSDYT